MTKTALMKELKSLGSEQARKTYARHGVSGKSYGVSYADFYRLEKRIKIDQELAEQLWDTGNYDARVLSTMIADPAKMTASLLDRWLKQVDNHGLGFALAGLAAKSPTAVKRAEKWCKSKQEWPGATGWYVVAALASDEACELDDDHLGALLERIESEIHQSKNRVRYSMNSALIVIGLRNPKLQKQALAAARRIGKVEVDHGDTSCKTSDASEAIKKAVAHRKAMAARRAAKKKPSKKKASKKKAATNKPGELDALLDKFSDDVQQIARAACTVVGKLAPKAQATVHGGWKLISYSYSGGMKATVCAVAPHAKHVNLQFSNGPALNDPKGLLEGTGKKLRHVKLRGPQEASAQAVKDLIKQAEKLAQAELS